MKCKHCGMEIDQTVNPPIFMHKAPLRTSIGYYHYLMCGYKDDRVAEPLEELVKASEVADND